MKGFTGKKHTIEARVKMSESKKGKHYPKLSERQVGEKNAFWKGGITTQNQLERVKFRETIQREVLKRDNYTCQKCGDKSGILHVDHIQSWAEYVELRFSMDNCRTLCRNCHYELTYGKHLPEKSKWGYKIIDNIYG